MRYMAAFSARSNTLETLVKAVVHEHPAALAEKEFAFLLDANDDPLQFSDFERVGFGEGFVKQPDAVLDLLLVDPDAKLPEQLVEGILHEVSFDFADFKTEFHNVRNFLEQKYCQRFGGNQLSKSGRNSAYGKSCRLETWLDLI